MSKGMITAIEYQKLPFEEQKKKRMVVGYIDIEPEEIEEDEESITYIISCKNGHSIEIEELCDECIEQLECLVEEHYDESY